MPFQSANGSAFPWVATHAKQSENHDNLGIATIFPKEQFAGFGDAGLHTKRVKTSYYGKLNVKAKEAFTYRFLAGWEKSKELFTTPEVWKKIVQEEVDEMAAPVTIETLEPSAKK
jgi:hypothetical protein